MAKLLPTDGAKKPVDFKYNYSIPLWDVDHKYVPEAHTHNIPSGALVCITEKLDGTMCAIGWDVHSQQFYATSKKGLKEGFVFTEKNNLYVDMLEQHFQSLVNLRNSFFGGQSFCFFGEIHGSGIQARNYNREKPELALFDIMRGDFETGVFLQLPLDTAPLMDTTFRVVPTLKAAVPFREDVICEIAEENSRLQTTLDSRDFMEGVVVRPLLPCFTKTERMGLKYKSKRYRALTGKKLKK